MLCCYAGLNSTCVNQMEGSQQRKKNALLAVWQLLMHPMRLWWTVHNALNVIIISAVITDWINLNCINHVAVQFENKERNFLIGKTHNIAVQNMSWTIISLILHCILVWEARLMQTLYVARLVWTDKWRLSMRSCAAGDAHTPNKQTRRALFAWCIVEVAALCRDAKQLQRSGCSAQNSLILRHNGSGFR